MAKTIKYKNDTYLDPTGVIAKNDTHKTLSNFLSRINTLNLSTTGGTAQEQYFSIATLNDGGNADASNLRIIGTSGGFTRGGLASFDITITSRDVGGFGTWYGSSGAWNYFDIQIYRGSDNRYRVYLHRKNTSYHGNTNILAMAGGAYALTCSPTATTPIGTLIKTFDIKNLTRTNKSYSTSEEIVSTWIDGKPVYEKTYEYTIPTGTNTWRSVGTISNVDKMFVQNASIVRGSELYIFLTDAYDLYFNKSNSTLFERHTSTYNEGYKMYITIRYTKTTD